MRVVQKIVCAALLGVTLSAWSTATLGAQTSIAERETVARVQKALERLPYNGMFDFLAFGLDRGTISVPRNVPKRGPKPVIRQPTPPTNPIKNGPEIIDFRPVLELPAAL